MEITWLEDFIALADCGNFSRAAQNRAKSQPAFSRRVQMLESWVGVSLFNRDTHRVELTAAGEQFRPVAEDIIRRLTLGRDCARDAANTEATTIKFASTHALSLTFFPNWLQKIEREIPLKGVVSLVTDNMHGCEQLMLRGQVQFLLCHYHQNAPDALSKPYFKFVRVGQDKLIPVSAPLETGSSTPMYPISTDPGSPVAYLGYTSHSGMGRIIAACQAQDSIPRGLAVKFTSHVATILMTMTKSGKGLAWLPLSLIQRALDRGELVRAGDASWDIPIDIRIYRARARQAPTAEDLWANVLSLADRSPAADDNVTPLQIEARSAEPADTARTTPHRRASS